MSKIERNTFFIGLSGGVDSSVAAALMQQAEYNIQGVFIKVWQPPFLECNWEDERLDAMRVAATLKIPFLTCDAEDEYRMKVVEYMISEYEKGRTPNPDIMCNKYVKFGVFLNFAKKNGARGVVTGHYARIENDGNARYLKRAKDGDKDQTYFLWTLTEEQRHSIYFPIGEYKKSTVRKLAKKFTLPTEKKPDSQGICMLGDITMSDFLKEYTSPKKGEVLNQEGECIGKHDGALLYTIGQRHGFTVTNGAASSSVFYVISKNISNNTITVTTELPKQSGGKIQLESVNQIIAFSQYYKKKVLAQTRYRQKPFAAEIVDATNSSASIKILELTETPTPGQSCVLYDDEYCLGGGIIAND